MNSSAGSLLGAPSLGRCSGVAPTALQMLLRLFLTPLRRRRPDQGRRMPRLKARRVAFLMRCTVARQVRVCACNAPAALRGSERSAGPMQRLSRAVFRGRHSVAPRASEQPRHGLYALALGRGMPRLQCGARPHSLCGSCGQGQGWAAVPQGQGGTVIVRQAADTASSTACARPARTCMGGAGLVLGAALRLACPASVRLDPRRLPPDCLSPGRLAARSRVLQSLAVTTTSFRPRLELQRSLL